MSKPQAWIFKTRRPFKDASFEVQKGLNFLLVFMALKCIILTHSACDVDMTVINTFEGYFLKLHFVCVCMAFQPFPSFIFLLLETFVCNYITVLQSNADFYVHGVYMILLLLKKWNTRGSGTMQLYDVYVVLN